MTEIFGREHRPKGSHIPLSSFDHLVLNKMKTWPGYSESILSFRIAEAIDPKKPGPTQKLVSKSLQKLKRRGYAVCDGIYWALTPTGRAVMFVAPTVLAS